MNGYKRENSIQYAKDFKHLNLNPENKIKIISPVIESKCPGDQYNSVT
jgi:hypothetical protein